VQFSGARRVMGNPVQFTCRRTARARTARARTAGTRNASMGSASAHNASMHSASTKHGPAHPRDVDDVDERSAHDLDECCTSTPRAQHEVVQHGHAQQWHAQQAHATRAQARTARAHAAGTRNTSTGAQARTTRGHQRSVSLLLRSYAPPAAAPPPPLTYARATHDHSADCSGRPCRGSRSPAE